MAAIQLRRDSYRILFRHNGKQHAFTLGRVGAREAEVTAAKVDYLLMRLRQGLITLPPGADVVAFVRHDGSPPPPASEAVAPSAPMTLSDLRDRYLATHGNGTLEATTVAGLRLHFKHLVATLGEGFPIRDLALADLQRHVDRRTRARGSRGRGLSPATMRKEIVTLRTAWNWGVRMGLLAGRFPHDGLRYPKGDERPPFQTRQSIERQLAAGGLDVAHRAELWDCLYLTLEDVEALLEHSRTAAGHGWIYPMLCTAAHTGARRSELLRMDVADVDFVGESILIREKKRSRGRRTTRRVPMSPFLSSVLRNWLAVHPGGTRLFCHAARVPQSKTKRTAPAPLTRDEAHDHFKRTLAGSPWAVVRGWHVLRHTFVSLCASRGIDQRLIDEWVGHTTDEVRRRYRHLYPSVQQHAIRSVFAEG